MKNKIILFSKKFLKALRVFISRVLADGGIVEARNYVNSLLKTVGDASLVLIPSAYKTGVLYSILPEDGTGDFTFSRASGATRVNSDGLIEEVSILGDELITNGGFDTDSDWINGYGGGVPIIADGRLEIFADVSTYGVTQLINIVAGTKYLITFEAELSSSHKIAVWVGSSAVSNAYFNTGQVQNQIGVNYNSFTFVSTYTGLAYFNLLNYSETSYFDNISVVEVFEEGIPRIDYTDGTPVLLTEPQSTNLMPFSEELNFSVYGEAPIVTLNYALSPSNTMTATRVQLDKSGGSISEFYKRLTLTVGNTYTLSFYAKSLSGTPTLNTAWIGSYTNEVTFTEEWERYTFTHTLTTTLFGFDLNNGGFIETITADMLIWGVQIEELPYATSYIPTTEGATVTRLGEAVTDGGDVNTFNSEEGVLFVEGSALSNDLTNRFIDITDGVAYLNGCVELYHYPSTNKLRYTYRTSGSVSQCDLIYELSDITENYKVACLWKENRFELWVNGIKVGEDLLGLVNPIGTFNTLELSRGVYGFPYYGKTKQLQVFKTALTDAELIELTTI